MRENPERNLNASGQLSAATGSQSVKPAPQLLLNSFQLQLVPVPIGVGSPVAA